jgi:hypothetical protein
MKILSKALFLIPVITFFSCAEQIPMQQLEVADLNSNSRFGQSLEISSNTLFVGAPGADGVTAGSGRVFLYSRADTGWVNAGELETFYRDTDMEFGASISADNGRAIVGAPGADRIENDAGTAMIFEQNEEGEWIQVALLAPDTVQWNANFGTSVSISGDMAVVGAIFGQTNNEVTGAAYIFNRQDEGTWEQTARLRPSNLNYDDRFGSSVAISGNTAVVGAPNDDEKGEDAGAAYIFERQDDGIWQEATKLAPAGRDGNFGSSMAISDNHIAIGAHWYLTEGTAFVFQKRANGTWHELTMLDPDNESFPSSNNDRFGRSIAYSGNRLLVGAPRGSNTEGDYTGVAWLFERNEDESWTEGELITFAESMDEDNFGTAVAISDNQIVIGASRSFDGRGSAIIVDR